VIGLLLLATLLVIGLLVVWFFVDRSMLATESRPAYTRARNRKSLLLTA